MLEPENFPIDQIYVPVKRKKALKPKLVQEIAESILEVGQQAPILVRPDEGRFVLVEGLHRLEACKALGENTIIGVSVSAEVVHGRKVFADTAEAEAEREKIVRLKRLRLEAQAAARLAASAQVEIPDAQSERLGRKHSQRTYRDDLTKARRTLKSGTLRSTPRSLSEWIAQQKRDGGHY